MTTRLIRTLVIALAFSTNFLTPAWTQDPADRFDIRDEMIPTRDGVKLHTKIYIPKKQQGDLPIIFNRSPYGTDRVSRHFQSYFKALADEGYIFAFQDIRGKFGSEGTFVMQRPART